MATRPIFVFEAFGLRIRIWGRPAVKFAVDIPHEKSLQRFVKWIFIIPLALRFHGLQEHLLAAASQMMEEEPVVRTACGLVVAAAALFLLWSNLRKM